MEPPKGRTGRPSKSFTLEQAKALLAVTEGTRMHAYVALSLLADIRTEEARALRWDHVVTWVDDAVGWQPVTSAGFDHARAGEDRFAIYVWRAQRHGATPRPRSPGGLWRSLGFASRRSGSTRRCPVGVKVCGVRVNLAAEELTAGVRVKRPRHEGGTVIKCSREVTAWPVVPSSAAAGERGVSSVSGAIGTGLALGDASPCARARVDGDFAPAAGSVDMEGQRAAGVRGRGWGSR